MATPNVGILTTTGKALIDKVNSGQAKISFSKVVFSSMDNSQLSDTQIKALTAIAPQEVVVSSPQTTLDTNSGETRIRATGTNEKLADGVYVKTYGVFAKDDTGNEILYGVTVSPNPNYFPAYDGVTPQAVTYSYKTVIQETSNITMTNSNDVYVSQEDLTEAIKPLPKDDNVVHNTGAEEVSGQKTFDIAPIDKTTGNPYITKSGVPKIDLSNYATQQQLATKADTSAIDPSVLLGAIPITSTTDLFTLDPGTYFGNNVTPVNGPAINSLPATNYFWVKLETTKANTSIKKLTWTDNGNHHYTNDYYGAPAKWHNWQVPNSTTMASKSDVTTAISTATANMVDSTKATNFTAGLQSGGVDVATAADLKSVEDASWHTITGKSDSLSAYTCMYRKNNEQKYVDLVLYGTMGITVDTSDSYTELLDLSEIISTPNKAKGGIVCPISAATGGGVSGSVSISGTKLLFSWNINNTLLYTGRPIISVGNDLNSPFLRVTFD